LDAIRKITSLGKQDFYAAELLFWVLLIQTPINIENLNSPPIRAGSKQQFSAQAVARESPDTFGAREGASTLTYMITVVVVLSAFTLCRIRNE